MSWKPEVLVNGEWGLNGMAFETKPEAEAWAKDLLNRWYSANDFRAVESEDVPNYRINLDTMEMTRLEGV